MQAPLPPRESERLAELRSYAILDTPPDPDFDDIVALAAELCRTPVALISFVDEHRQWFKSRLGFEAPETTRETSFCAHALGEGGGTLVVPDATKDPRFADNPLVTARDGVRFYLGAPLVTPRGHVLGTLCVVDRQPRKPEEAQLRALETLSRHVMAQLLLRRQNQELARIELEQRQMAARLIEAQAVARMGSWETDLATLDVSWSEETHRIFGTDPAGFHPTHQGFLALVHPDDRERVNRAFVESAAGDGPFVIDHRIRRPDGEERVVGERWQVFRDPAGRPIRAVGTCQDITERRRQEAERQAAAEALRRSEERFQLAVRGSTAAIWDWTYADGRIDYAPRYREMLGLSEDEFPGTLQAFWDHVHPEDRPTVEVALAAHFGPERRRYEVEFRMRHRSGEYRWFGATGQAVIDPEGRPLRMVGFTYDITARKQSEALLRDTLLAMQEAQRVASLGTWRLDLETGKVTWSDQLYLMLGLDPSQPPPDYATHSRLFTPESWQRLSAAVERAGSTGEPYELELEMLRRDGSPMGWMLARGAAARNEDGRIVRLVGIAQDITERKRADLSLRAALTDARRLREALDRAPAYVYMKDRESRYLFANAPTLRLFGCTAAELVGADDTRFFPPAAVERLREIDRRVIRGEESNEIVDVTDASGVRRIYAEFKTPIYADEGRREIVGLLGISTDITDAKRSEERLKEQAALIDNAHDAIVVRDPQHHIVYWNRAAEKLYGWTSAEALGRKMNELLQVDGLRYAEAEAVLFARGSWNGEIQKTAKDGRLLTVECSWSLQRDPQGRPKSILTIDTDITERRSLEQQFLRAQRMESIGTLAGGIAHDLNNLLAPITMGVELLRRNESDPRSRMIIDNIENSARRGAALVKQVLSFARGVEGARVLLQVKHVLREVEAIVENTFPKNITFELHPAPDLWPVTGDPTQLNQVILNLCVNARDAMPNGGRLRIQADNVEVDEQYAVMNRGLAAGRYVVIKVIDDGIGIPPEIIDRIFEPFFTTKQIGQGTGLGLSTVLAIVRSHGGLVNVYSEPGKGSTFKVYLPAQAESVVPENGAPGDERFPRGSGELVLVADDEQSIANVTRQSLEAFGYRVVTAEDGAQAISQYAMRQQEIALVLTDMMMPVIDGAALIAALRRINPRVRIIAMSGLYANAHVAQASHAGVRHFLAKPFSTEALLRLVAQALHESGSRPPM